jgi:hypothetical protein
MPERSNHPGEGVLPLPKEGFGSKAWWEDAIQAGEEKRDQIAESTWKPNVKAYQGDVVKQKGEIRVNVDFYNTEQKKAQLFFRVPQVQLTAKRPEFEDAVVVFQPVINHKVGPHGVNAGVMMDEVLFDCLCPSGLMVSKIGYEAIEDGKIPIQIGEEPVPISGSVLGLQTVMQPIMGEAPRIVFERYFWDRISPAKAGWLSDFHGSDFDKAAALWFEFVEDLEVAKRKGWVSKDFTGSGEDTHRLVDDPKTSSRGPIVVGREIWYRAARFDPKVKHPEHLRQLVLIDGLPQPAVHRDSPYQRFDPQSGRLIAGMRGFPIHIGTLRYVSDTAFPPSDCTISRAQVDELGAGRTQMQQQRARSIPMRWGDKNRIDPNDLEKFKKAEWQNIWLTDGRGDEIIGEVARAEYPRENFSFVDVVQSDINREWALSENSTGQTEGTSATEASLIQTNINTRQDYERTKVLNYFVRGVEKLASLVQLFADQEDYIEVVGENGEKRLQAWDRTQIQGEFVFSAKPDSAQRVDAVQDRKLATEAVNYMIKSPVTNQVEVAKWFWAKLGEDPARMVQPPQPPGPPPPNVSVRVTMEDLAGPAARAALKILQQAGYQLTEEDILVAQAGQMVTDAQEAAAAQDANAEHGGPADKADVLSKRNSDMTGQLNGAGTVPAAV